MDHNLTGTDPGSRAPAASPLPALALYLLGALLALALVWAAWATVDVRVAGRGRIVNDAQNILVRTLEPGVLSAVRIRPGQVVKKGEVIATLDATFAGADQSQLAARDQSLRAQVERLRQQTGERGTRGALDKQADQRALLAEREAAYQARLRQYDESIARLRSALEGNAADQRVTAERTTSLLDLEKMQEKLTLENFVSRSKVLETKERRLEAERDLTAARGRQAELQKEIRVTEAERESFVTAFRQKVREELTQATRDSDEVREQLSKAQRRAELVTVVAPQDAVVLEVRQTALGGVLTPSDVLAVLVPLGETVLAEADIDPADVGEIRAGDRVRLKLDAYPFQKHGVLEGRLLSISGDAITLESGAPGGARTVYRARIALQGRGFSHSAQSAQLMPGMTMTAEVIVGSRSVLSYLLYPLMRAGDEAIRER